MARESRHKKTLECQRLKFERLCQKYKGGHSNIHHGDHVSTSNETASDSNSNNNTWVRIISNKPLTEAQEQLLAHEFNFAVVPRCPPVGEFIAAVEQVCQQLKQGEAEESQGEVKAILKKVHTPRSNITKEEIKALKELKIDNTRMILTTDKGVSIVVMDRDEYIKKAEELLHQPTYKTIPADPTTKYKNKLITLLKTIKQKVGLKNHLQKAVPYRGRIPQILWVT